MELEQIAGLVEPEEKEWPPRLEEFVAQVVPLLGDMWTGSRWVALPFTCSCGVEIKVAAGFARDHMDHFNEASR